MTDPLLLARHDTTECFLLPALTNRHGLITGAGISQPGKVGAEMAAVIEERGIDIPQQLACPVTLCDVFGEQGHPVCATISDMGPCCST